MSSIKLTNEEELLKELSEIENPYSQNCPNRHLWSEGFRKGFLANESIKEFLLYRTAKENHKNKQK